MNDFEKIYSYSYDWAYLRDDTDETANNCQVNTAKPPVRIDSVDFQAWTNLCMSEGALKHVFIVETVLIPVQTDNDPTNPETTK